MGKSAQALEKSGIGATGEDNISGDINKEAADITLQRESGKYVSRLRENEADKNRQFGVWDERLSLAVSGSTEASESFRVLRSRILHPDDHTMVYRTILIASTAPWEGKSFVSANLGITLAKGMDQRALLVDCDLRRPTLARLFGLSGDRGLSDYLQKGDDLVNLIQKTSVDKMTLLASGKSPVNPAELLGSAKMHELVRELAGRYEDRFIIFDSPPILAASEALVLAQKVDGVVLVIRHGHSSRTQVKKIVELIGKDQIIGVVFNGYERNYLETKVLGQYQYYGSYYGEARNTQVP